MCGIDNVAAYLNRLSEFDIWMTPIFSTAIVRVGISAPEITWLDQRDLDEELSTACNVSSVENDKK